MDKNKKALVFPKEHGSWALTFEPLTLALVIAPSWNGLILFLGSAFAFFAHPSAKAILASRFKNKTALLIFLSYSVPAVLFLAFFIDRTSYPVYLSLLLALALMVFYLLLEVAALDRELVTELMASFAMGFIALSIVESGGMDWIKGLSFLALLYSRSLMTTIYIHYRLLKLKNRIQSVWVNNTLHILDFVLILFLWYRHWIPALGVVAVLILMFRALWGVSFRAGKTTVRKLGFKEVYFGLTFLVLVVLGYWLGL